MPEVTIIAECGVNHNGSPELAHQLVEACADAGADVVKFQTFQAAALTCASAALAPYQQEQGEQGGQRAMLRRLELSAECFAALARHARQRGLMFLSSPFDLPSIDVVAGLEPSLWKIPSGEITNVPYLRKVASFGQPIILSTGMCTLDEVDMALRVLAQAGAPPELVTLLHCTSEYPAPYAEVNLRAMHTLRAAFPQCAGVGYSDHTEGMEIPLAAVALGATVIEKHCTLDRNMEGPDHKASLACEDLALLVRGVRRVCSALGDGHKAPTASELHNRDLVRKSIVAARPIRAGEILTPQCLTTKRPGTGMSPLLWDSVMGTPCPRDLIEDEAL